MKTVSVLFAAAVFVFASTSCDKHSWESTQVLHEGMHKEHKEGDGHGDAHHGEAKKDSHGTPAAEHKPEAKH